MKLTVIRILSGALGTIFKGLIKGIEDLEIRGQAETINTKALVREVRILKSLSDSKSLQVSRTLRETCYHLNSSEELSANDGVNSQTLKRVK